MACEAERAVAGGGGKAVRLSPRQEAVQRDAAHLPQLLWQLGQYRQPPQLSAQINLIEIGPFYHFRSRYDLNSRSRLYSGLARITAVGNRKETSSFAATPRTPSGPAGWPGPASAAARCCRISVLFLFSF